MLESGLAGKVALITGGSRGIGAAIALALAMEGVHLAIASLEDEADQAGAMRAAGVEVACFRRDLASELEAVGAVQDTLRRFGRIDLFVHSAGAAWHEPVTRLSGEAWLRTFHTNLSSCAWACREVCRHMVPRRAGSILMVGSAAQHARSYGEAAYHASKTGLRVLMQSVAVEMAPYGIRANLLVPGHFPTALTSGLPPERAERLRREIPLRRFGQPAECGPAAVFLLSDRLSTYTTGAELAVSGGLHLRPLNLCDEDELVALNRWPAGEAGGVTDGR